MRTTTTKLAQPIMILGLGVLNYPSCRASLPHRVINHLTQRYNQRMFRISPTTLTGFNERENILFVKQDDSVIERDLRQIMDLYDLKDLKSSIVIYPETMIPPLNVFACKQGKSHPYRALNSIIGFGTEDFYRIGIGIDKAEKLAPIFGDEIGDFEPEIEEQRFLLTRVNAANHSHFMNITLPVILHQIDTNISEILLASKKIDVEKTKPSIPITQQHQQQQTPPQTQNVISNINNLNNVNTPIHPYPPSHSTNVDRRRYGEVNDRKHYDDNSQTNRHQQERFLEKEPPKREPNIIVGKKTPKREPNIIVEKKPSEIVGGGRFGRGRVK